MINDILSGQFVSGLRLIRALAGPGAPESRLLVQYAG